MVLTYDEYKKKKKKEIEERNKKEYEKNSVSVGKNKISSTDIAPIKQQTNSNGLIPLNEKFSKALESAKQNANEMFNEPKKTTTKKEDRTWFSGGAFSDGYQFGDVTKTILGTTSDVTENLFTGALGIGEKVVDAGAYLLGGGAKLFGNDNFAKKTQNFIEKDLINEEKIAKGVNTTTPAGMLNYVLNKGNTDEASLFGEKTDSLAQSGGQLLGTIGLQAVGVPWWLTTGATSFGAETEQAFKQGATYGEAGFSGLVSAGAEILTEKLSGGISFGGKTLDDGLQKLISEKISNKVLQKLTKVGVDMAGEGAEEVLTEVISNVGKKLSYEDEKTWAEMLTSEEAMDSYLEAFIGGAVLGGVGSASQRAFQQAEQELGRPLTEEEKTKIEKSIEKASKTEVKEDIAPVKEQDDLPNSKVRDKDGKLLTVYHGTRADFDTYDTSKAGQNYEGNWSNNGKGIYFTDNKAEAQEYAESSIDEGDPKIKEAQLDITNPFDSSKDYTNELSEMAKEYGIEPYYLERGDRLFNWFNINKKDIVEALSKYGYDGIVDHGHYTVFDPKQIKNVESNKNIQKNIMEGQETAEDNNIEQDVDYKINSSMTMDEARDMLQRAFVLSDIKEYSDGAITNIDEWVNSEDWSYQIPMMIENDYNLQSKYINSNPDIVDNELYTIDDIIEAYKNGTLIGKEKAPTKRLDLSKDTNYKDDRFYAPQDIKGDSNLYNVASQRVTNSNRADVYKARADFIINAHNKGYVDSLGLTQEEVNKKLKSWANYPKKAMDLSNSFNEGVPLQNRWTGIENSSIVNTISISNKEMGKLVKEIKGDSSEWQRQYITSTMLALDTHIDYSRLTFEFEAGQSMSKNALGEYENNTETIRIRQAGQNTVAHEMGHYIDHLWARELGLGKFASLTDRNINFNKLNAEQTQFVKNFHNFLNDIESTSDIGSQYKMSSNEVFARFVARFTEWTKNQATNNRYGYEAKWYKDNFNERQYREFVKILQEKALLDTTGQTTAPVQVKDTQGRILTQGQQEFFKDVSPEVKDENGNLKVLYHGSNVTDITVFKKDKFGDVGISFLTDDADIADTYRNKNGRRYEFYANIKNPLVIDGEGKNWNDIVISDNSEVNSKGKTTDQLVLEAYNSGKYDGVVFKNIVDRGSNFHKAIGRRISNVYVAFNSNQIKNVDNTDPTNSSDIRYSLDEDIAPVDETKALAETQATENIQSITDNDISPVQENTTPEYESNSATMESPFDSKDMKEVGSQKVKAYQFENPEIKPFFKTEAEAMLGELENTVKGARLPIYDEVGNMEYVGVTRETTEAIAYLKDNYNYTYAEIEKGLKAIIEDDGKENIAVAKRIEFMLDDRLRNGYTSIDGTEIPANQDYINLLHEKGYTAYNQEVSQGLTDEFAPVETVETSVENASETKQVEEIAPVKEQAPTLKEAVETEDPVMKAVKNKVRKELEKTIGERRNELIRDDQYANNNIVIKKKPTLKESASRTWDALQSHHVNRNHQIDKLSKATGNKEIKFKGDRINNISGEIGGDIFTAQTDNYGNVIGKSLDAPFESARKEGLDTYFDNYLKHQSNIERHAQGKGSAKVSAEASKKYVKAYESKYPQFKEWAKDVYTYNQNLLDNAVQNGLIDEYFKNTLTTMYGKYVPFYEQNAEPSEYMTPEEIKASKPIKRAKGGSDTNLLGIEQAIIQQTYAYKNAIAKNDLYKEIGSVMGKKVELGADLRTSPTELNSTLYADENGKYLTYYENGKQKTVQITDELYQELSRELENQIRKLEDKYSIITKPLQKISQIRGQILTTYNIGFVLTNPFKDVQDAVFNTKYFGKYLKNVLTQSTIRDSVKGKNVNEYATEFKKLTGKDITSVKDPKTLKGKARAIYKDWQAGTMWNRFITSYGTNSTSMEFADGEVDVKAKNKGFLNAIERANNYMEVMFRYPEFKATLEKGGSFTEALYNAREVTTNFGRGGTISKAINRNGATFYNTSIQGMDKFFRNFSGENGARGFIGAVSKAVSVGMLPAILNHLLLDDDEEYEALPDYIKDNYYLFKTGYGEFIRIPKGRMIAVLGSAGRRTLELADGEEDAFEGYLTNASDQIGASNPLKENIFSPIVQAVNNEAWYGGDLVPTRLQNKPKAEQFDEGTDEFSKWLGKQLNISPYKINYVIDQYSGGFGDVLLPMITDEAKSDGTLLAPLKDKFTANSTDDNKYVGELYDLSEEFTIKANGESASEEDILKNKYLNSIKSQMSELYKEKREIQNSDFSKEAKYEMVKVIQNQINALAKEGLDFHTEIETTDNYATVGYYGEYYKTTEGEWYSINEEELEDINSMGMTTEEKNSYFGAKNNIYKIKDDYEDLINASTEDEQDNLYTEQKRAIIDEVRNTNLTDEEKAYLYDRYYGSTDKLNVITETNIPFDTYLEIEYQDFKADKNRKGQSISGSKKKKIMNFIESSGLDYNQKIILHKVYYPADDSYNYDIVDYVFNNVETYETRINILETLGFRIDENGVVHWE